MSPVIQNASVSEDRSILTRAAPPPDDVVAYGPGPEQVADVRFTKDPAVRRPLVLLIHGGFWRPDFDRAHTGPMAAALAEAGWTVAALEYRRVPHQPGDAVEDIARACQVLPGKIASHDGRALLMGHSAGGHLALWAASKRPASQIVGALALAPVADLQLAHELNLDGGAALDFLGEAPSARPDLDPKRMPAPTTPTSIVHGDSDEIVPLRLAESYVATHAGTRLVKVPGAGHFALIDPLTPAWGIVTAELDRLARRS